MTTGLVKEQNLEKQIEKQMGCMAGFLQIFDRHQILTGKRLYSAKRLPPSPVADTASESGKSAPASPEISRDLGKPLPPHRVASPSPQRSKQTPEAEVRSPVVSEVPPKSPLPLPIFELKEGTRSSWKFCKEAPRLSLDSRATTDAKGSLHPKEIRTTTSILSVASRSESIASDTTDGGQHHRSPSVIARLMGLEPLPDSSCSEPEKKPELRRSASESRVSKELFQSRFTADGSNFYSKQQTQSHYALPNNVKKDNAPVNAHYADPRNHSVKNGMKAEPPEGLNRGCHSTSPWRAPQHRKSFFDSGDIFPEPKQTVSIYGEIEKRLKMRGIDEPSKDLETLKQILEALQLKGLLHSKPPSQQNQIRHRNIVYDESPIVLMKPSRSSPSVSRRMGNDYSPSNSRNQFRGVRRNYSMAGETSPSVSPRRERNARSPARTGRSPSPTTRSSEGNASASASARRSNSLVKPKPLSIETQSRANESAENRRASPVHSPKLNTRRTGLDPTASNRSPRSKKSTPEIHKITTVVVAEDESSSISGSSITTSTDTERSKAEEYKEGRNLLERCDKLLHSIAEMAATDMQPSPVSVLDSSFYKDDSLTPSPVTTKRTIDFKDQSGELEEEPWSPLISPIRSKCLETSDDCDYVYISDILRASHYLSEDSDVFLLLEKQQYLKGNDTSKVSRLQRKLIFDTINEILDRNRWLPPWKVVDITKPSLDKVWLEFQRIRERDGAEDLFETVCGVLRKDLAGDAIMGWGDCPVEMSEAVLDIERLIFKDLICEAIGDLAALASRGTLSSVMPRRKLVF
ncbi:protein LONGIFOLIA 1 [Sesamum angolense]|uniref:Protein LONGIFOLIA 1 n=1 Tax=Sesamum angolense TaxID=2727404 RepID=A0AAE1T5T1_9LAMI|nr:protein LONGIFOLIA 1 [Sesamum angolense]